MRPVAIAFVLLSFSSPGFAQTESSPAASPTPTPFPSQDPPPGREGVPPGYDDAILVPATNGEPSNAATVPPPGWERTDDPEKAPPEKDSKWDPKKVFPGNYWALPFSADFSFHPCLDCRGVPAQTPFLKRPGELSIWVGYAFQPFPQSSSPFMAGGVDWLFLENGEDGRNRHRLTLAPTWRVGWNWTGENAYSSFGVVLPGTERTDVGYRVGVGASSFALLALAVCIGEAVPSVIEGGYEWIPPDKRTGERRDRFTLKLGWGF